MLGKNQDNDFIIFNLTNINSITIKTQAVNDNQVTTKAYFDQFHLEDETTRRDVGLDFYDESRYLVKNNQEKIFIDNKLTIVRSITVNKNPTSENELCRKKYIDVELEKISILRLKSNITKLSESICWKRCL